MSSENIVKHSEMPTGMLQPATSNVSSLSSGNSHRTTATHIAESVNWNRKSDDVTLASSGEKRDFAQVDHSIADNNASSKNINMHHSIRRKRPKQVAKKKAQKKQKDIKRLLYCGKVHDEVKHQRSKFCLYEVKDSHCRNFLFRG